MFVVNRKSYTFKEQQGSTRLPNKRAHELLPVFLSGFILLFEVAEGSGLRVSKDSLPGSEQVNAST